MQNIVTPALVFCLLLLSGLNAAERVDYVRDVKPILQQKCYSCHGALKQEGGLRLDTGALARLGGDSGAGFVPGQPADSLLLDRVTDSDEDLRMPQQATPLTSDQIGTLRAWIEQGALASANEEPESDPRGHWSFRPLTRPRVPRVRNAAWVRNPIDAFIAAEHERRGLVPNRPARRAQLLRRVHIDLLGVPPTREELRAFLAEDSPNAYERLVDRLLSSPQYGERWGRHWMDVWRYSDWYGRRGVPDVLNSYAQIWRWRDWIVRSLNRDKGYDRMVMEMLAADEIAPGDDANVVATGFIVRNFYRWNYNTWMKDQVEHTGKAFLALTLNCCHCHDHKYDPITNEEYFRFRAFFEPIEVRHDRVPGEPDPGIYPKYEYGKPYKPIESGMVRVMDEKLAAETFVYTGGESRNVVPGQPPVRPGGPAVLAGDELAIEPVDLPPQVWYPGLKPFVQQEEISRRERELDRAGAARDESQRQLAAAESDSASTLARLALRVDLASVVRAEAELEAIHARIAADNARYKGRGEDPDALARVAARAERQAAITAAHVELARAEQALAVARNKPAHEGSRAQAIQQAEQQRAAAQQGLEEARQRLDSDSVEYTPLSPQYPPQSTGRRAALARWISSNSNPLTPRVAVNHIWLRHFGQALVDTTDNFGRNGARPTHPELLDWLAAELIQATGDEPASRVEGNERKGDEMGSWKMKRLHRLIVTSNSYRMRSGTEGFDHPNYERDRDNRYLWRYTPARMEAEVIRDSILSTAGNLDLKMGGKEIEQDQGLTVPRRSIYFSHHGEGRMQMLELFDAANPVDCYRRSTSVRPQQALVMANSELAIRQGRLLAKKLEQACLQAQGERRKPEELFVIAAFEQVLSRGPTAEELAASLDFVREQADLFERLSPEELLAMEPASAAAPAAATSTSSAAASRDLEVPPSTNPLTRARENLVQALFSHSDFVTLR